LNRFFKIQKRYGWDWWNVWLLSLNAILPMILAFAAVNNSVEEWARMHSFLSVLAIVMNLWVVLVLSWRWLFYCNNSFSGMQSACNDYRWCCVFYPSVWCPNTMACNPVVPYSDLQRNNEMEQHWAFSFVFFLLAWWHININQDMREFGMLH